MHLEKIADQLHTELVTDVVKPTSIARIVKALQLAVEQETQQLRVQAEMLKETCNSQQRVARRRHQLLANLEWEGKDDENRMCCPCCFSLPNQEHDPDCKVMISLKESRTLHVPDLPWAKEQHETDNAH